MAYELYSCDHKHFTLYQSKNQDHLEIKCEKITAKLGGWKNAVRWNIAAAGKVNVYAVYDEGKMIHSSYVVCGR